MVLWIKVNVYANCYLATPFWEVLNKANERAVKNKRSHEFSLNSFAGTSGRGINWDWSLWIYFVVNKYTIKSTGLLIFIILKSHNLIPYDSITQFGVKFNVVLSSSCDIKISIFFGDKFHWTKRNQHNSKSNRGWCKRTRLGNGLDCKIVRDCTHL
jgi:hypothetical protein